MPTRDTMKRFDKMINPKSCSHNTFSHFFLRTHNSIAKHSAVRSKIARKQQAENRLYFIEKVPRKHIFPGKFDPLKVATTHIAKTVTAMLQLQLCYTYSCVQSTMCTPCDFESGMHESNNENNRFRYHGEL